VRNVRTGLTIGLIGQLALLVTLGATVSLSVLGWVVGIGYGVFTTVALGRGLTSAGATVRLRGRVVPEARSLVEAELRRRVAAALSAKDIVLIRPGTIPPS